MPRLIFRWGNYRRRATRTSESWRLLAVPLLLLMHSAVGAEAKRVLVLYSNNRLGPANTAAESGMRQEIKANPAQPIQIFSEFLDEPEFGGDRYEHTISPTCMISTLIGHPTPCLAAGDAALRFMLRYRDRLFPGVPIVHAGVTRSTLQSMRPLPPDVVGVPVAYDFAGTVQQALKWHPRATHLIIVTGASIQDAQLESVLRPEIAPVLGNVQAEYLAGLTLPALEKRLRELGSDSVVLTIGFFRDGDGRSICPATPPRSLRQHPPHRCIRPADTFMGTGVVGGRMLSYEQIGRQAAQILERLFSGDPDWRRVPEAATSVLEVDWRQIKRWGIDPAQLPHDTVIAFRPPTLWQAYRNAALGAVTIILLLSALVASLLLERRRRRTAEIAVQKQHLALAHASRLAVAGELTAAIAHEINQPLGAVQTNADTAEVILQAGGDRREDLLRLVGRIRNDNLRASEVIRRLRTLLARHEARRQPLDLNVILTDVEAFLRGRTDAATHGACASTGGKTCAHSRGRDADPASFDQSDPQCDGRLGRRAGRPARHSGSSRIRRRNPLGLGEGPRAGVCGQRLVEALRFVLQHETNRHGAWPVHRAYNRRGTRRYHPSRERRRAAARYFMCGCPLTIRRKTRHEN